MPLIHTRSAFRLTRPEPRLIGCPRESVIDRRGDVSTPARSALSEAGKALSDHAKTLAAKRRAVRKELEALRP